MLKVNSRNNLRCAWVVGGHSSGLRTTGGNMFFTELYILPAIWRGLVHLKTVGFYLLISRYYFFFTACLVPISVRVSSLLFRFVNKGPDLRIYAFSVVV